MHLRAVKSGIFNSAACGESLWSQVAPLRSGGLEQHIKHTPHIDIAVMLENNKNSMYFDIAVTFYQRWGNVVLLCC